MFLKKGMINTSEKWQGMISTVLFICFLMFVGFLAAGTVYQTQGIWIFWCIIIAALFAGIMNVAARANSAMDFIEEVLVNAAPDDFVQIGGRDEWIQWTTTVRLAFTLYGVEITQSLLLSTVATVVSSMFGAIFSVLL